MPNNEPLTSHITLSPTPTNNGDYLCLLIRAGYVKQDDGQDSDWLIPAAVLREAVPLFTVPAYLDHPSRILFGYEDPQVAQLFGMFHDPQWSEEDQGITATLSLYNEHPDSPGARVHALITRILADQAAGLDIPPIGWSANAWQTRHLDEETGNLITDKIIKCTSVDLVYEAGAGGYIQAALSPLKSTKGDPIMPEETTTVETRLDALEAQLATSPPPPPPPGPDPQTDRLTAIETTLTQLAASLAHSQEDNTIHDLGDPAIRQMRNSLDQIQIAATALLSGVRPAEGVRSLTGIRELYLTLSGDYELTGRYHPDRVMLANVNSSTMAGLVANALNKTVIQLYAEFPKWWKQAVTPQDFATLQDVRWITLGGVGELPTVLEGKAYQELTWDDRTETDPFIKKGGYLGITLETIDKDDTGKIQAVPRVLAQGAWLTLGKAIAAIASGSSGLGPDMSDGVALFNASHSNLGSSALSFAAWKATKIAMMKQAELNSDERYGALTRPHFLWSPIDLEEESVSMLASANEPGTADNDININAQGDAREERLRNARARVISVPLWTNTANWMAQADPRLFPTIGIGYRYGRQPEIFSVASPTAGLMFTNDTMPVKVRFFFAVGPMTWNGLYKHNV